MIGWDLTSKSAATGLVPNQQILLPIWKNFTSYPIFDLQNLTNGRSQNQYLPWLPGSVMFVHADPELLMLIYTNV